MNLPNNAEEEATPTICLDCGRSYLSGEECPTCQEAGPPVEETPQVRPEDPEITLPDVPERDKPVKTNPAICLDCGQTFVGTVECPSCQQVVPPAEPEISLPDESLEEEEPIDTELLLEEMRDLGFRVTAER